MKEVRLVSVAGASAVLYTAVVVVAIFLFADIGLLDAEKSLWASSRPFAEPAL